MAIIDKPSDYFNTKLYSGDGSSPVSVTGVGFQPDWVWVKRRNGTTPHVLYDAVRGTGKQLISNDTSSEATNNQYGYISSFEADGFEATAGSTSITRLYGSGGTYVAWNWLAGGTASSNTDGSITSSVSANTTSGFSIVTYTGTQANATVGHGLGSAPRMILFKRYGTTGNWGVYHESLGNTKSLSLNTTAATDTDIAYWNNTSPTSSVFSLGGSSLGNKSTSMIAYCFAEVKGYSKFGSYTGNGNSDGTFVYTGFKPAWVMVKETSNVNSWRILDNKRSPINVMNEVLYANLSNAEGTSGHATDFVSNGFKIRDSDTSMNRSGGSFIYMCFAENPFVSSTGVPATAR